MNDHVLIFLMSVILHVTLAVIGFGFAFLGYQLFVRGVYEQTSDMRAAWGNKHIIIKQAAPGIMFALFGAGLIITSMFQGVTYESSTPDSAEEADTAAGETNASAMTSEKAKSTTIIQALTEAPTAEQKADYETLFQVYDPQIDAIVESKPEDRNANLTTLYLAVLGRKPTPQELEFCEGYIENAAAAKIAVQDLLWALLNSPEYVARRRFSAEGLIENPIE